ncbi:phosphoglucosamine mutase [Anaerococcus hydrogenalis]|uniref:Phosphoglucosamine mutase n=1 Tax=Anaerococcus hydrogenalis TaxID=33029 RepID=A0A2N6UKU0_9FIRM|nr:phosphoglucosamine mutase [Anaerococcus hydrogenalis]MBS5989066.1 phosphoglucosamine mutase [Anaerococcus hydrogenalis]MDK7694428.1 phosphoglucosamine mutase [Anaerococcus hydrogenalis]MDK7696206.1 phosphoglucosamine mutase [Anaerococcus hydrogenalis]MDK7707455.1 phosphoglucosamine mutase [Anaerococcus hydrogenalis]PMC82470.1 phosphoglucosamine mutase [Anaerococcus hydrogenalis]
MKYFGTDGFRGEANQDLTLYHAIKIGRFLGYYFNKEKNGQGKIVIGKDTRRSSYMFEDALSAGITSSGSDAYLLHVTTTPSVSYVVRSEDFDCGVMITASHNPYHDNGIKIINSDGEKMDDEFLEKLEEYIDSDITDIDLKVGEEIGRTHDFIGGRNRYIAFLIQTVSKSFKGKKVGLDCSNGAASSIVKSVYDALGAETFVINNNPNGFNINVDCGSTHIEVLQKYVKENKLDCGFAYDGDADRCIAVDEKGEVVDGDAILYICGKHMKEEGSLESNTVVTTIMSNIGLYKAFDKIGIKYSKTNVGDKYVHLEMSENGYELGGEQSGHIIFSKYANTGDGILTSLRLMEAMIENKTTLSELRRDLKIYPQVLKNVRVKDKNEVLNDEKIKNIIEQKSEGLKDKGRILVRESGTEPLIRVMAEAESEKEAKEKVNEIIKVIEDSGL